MGSRKKKKRSSSSRPSQQQQQPHPPPNRGGTAGLVFERGLYHTYKACTESVTHWGLATWKEHHKSNSSNSKSSNGKSSSNHHHTTLQSIVSKLDEVADREIPMPRAVFRQLQTAIRYRKEVGIFYTLQRRRTQSGDGSNNNHDDDGVRQSDLDGHAWIIQQLSRLKRRFRFLVEQEEEEEAPKPAARASGAASVTAWENGQAGGNRLDNHYSVLRYDREEEENDDDQDQDGREASDSTERPLPPRASPPRHHTPTEEEIRHEEKSFAIACALAEIHQTRVHVRTLWRDWHRLTSEFVAGNPSGGGGEAPPSDDGDAPLEFSALAGELELAPATLARAYRKLSSAKEEPRPFDETHDRRMAGELFGIAIASNYAIQALRGTLLSTSMEFDGYDFDEALAGDKDIHNSSNSTTSTTATRDDHLATTFRIGDRVTLQKLSRTELNGAEGEITGTILDGRYPVQLCDHCQPSSSSSTTNGSKTKKKKKKTYLLKPHNLIDSDDTFLRLRIVRASLSSFDCDARAFVDDPNDKSGFFQHYMNALSTEGELAAAIANRDLSSFMDLVAKHHLHSWYVCHKRPAGPAEPVVGLYLREFWNTRTVSLHLCFAILCVFDASVESHHPGAADTTQQAYTNDLVNRSLRQACHPSSYQTVIDQYTRQNLCTKWFTDIRGDIDSKIRVHSMLYAGLPWLSAISLQEGLRHNLCALACVPMESNFSFRTLLHLYWMLRVEGHLGRIDAIETGLIRLYRQQAWFKSGMPQKKRGNFVKSWQFSQGCNAAGLKAIDGVRLKGAKHRKSIDHEGFHCAEMSRLLDIIQWKSVEIPNTEEGLEGLRNLAREECDAVFLAPVFQTAIKLWKLEVLLQRGCIQGWHDYVVRDVRLKGLSNKMDDLSKVAFWGLSMADGLVKISEDEKHAGLKRIAQCFEITFPSTETAATAVGDGGEETELVLSFNPNEHHVSSELYGDRAIFYSAYSNLNPGDKEQLDLSWDQSYDWRRKASNLRLQAFRASKTQL